MAPGKVIEMRIEPDISGVNIVFLGTFNPAIFTPAWFAMHELLPRSVTESADLQIANQWTTVFTTDWLNLNVGTERFIAETRQAPHVRVRDLVVRVFKEHLYHTPLTAFGINREIHFQVRSSVERDRIGRMLAPVEAWGPWSKELGSDGRHGGMTSLTMTQINPKGRPEGGSINVKVEPSRRVGGDWKGVYVTINDHYITDKTGPGSAEDLLGLLEDNFDSSILHSDDIVDHIMSLAKSKVD